MVPSQADGKKLREARHLALARRLFRDEFPAGDFEQPDPPAPDILVRAPDGVVGIEITQIFQEDEGVEGAQQAILSAARKQHLAAGGEPLFVNVSFAPGWPPRKPEAVATLRQLVFEHKPRLGSGACVYLRRATAPRLLPAWLQGLTILSSPGEADPAWIGGSVWSTVSLTPEKLEACVRKKEPKIDGYRRYCDRIWLLLVCDLYPMVASFSVPHEASAWSFRHKFDRVLLVSREGDHLTF